MDLKKYDKKFNWRKFDEEKDLNSLPNQEINIRVGSVLKLKADEDIYLVGDMNTAFGLFSDDYSSCPNTIKDILEIAHIDDLIG